MADGRVRHAARHLRPATAAQFRLRITNPSEVSFIARRDLCDLLVSAAKQIKDRFDDGDLSLEVFDERLAVVVGTALSVEDASAGLESIEREWWLAARGDRPFVSLKANL